MFLADFIIVITEIFIRWFWFLFLHLQLGERLAFSFLFFSVRGCFYLS